MTISLVTHAQILEKGLTAFKKVLDQEVKINREEMFDLVNFEMFLIHLIAQWKMLEGKTPEEVLQLAQEGVENETKNL